MFLKSKLNECLLKRTYRKHVIEKAVLKVSSMSNPLLSNKEKNSTEVALKSPKNKGITVNQLLLTKDLKFTRHVDSILTGQNSKISGSKRLAVIYRNCLLNILETI